MEIEHTGDGAAFALVGGLRKLQRARQVEGDLDPDMKYAWTNGAIHLSRFHWFPQGFTMQYIPCHTDASGDLVGSVW
ncbi:hypothetical protein MMC27_004812 [Xylographa pallens]|nr:hypothetical protein [Xylographa pallens]